MMNKNLYVWRTLKEGYDIGKVGAYASTPEEARTLIRSEWKKARDEATNLYWLEQKLRQEPEVIDTPEAFV